MFRHLLYKRSRRTVLTLGASALGAGLFITGCDYAGTGQGVDERSPTLEFYQPAQGTTLFGETRITFSGSAFGLNNTIRSISVRLDGREVGAARVDEAGFYTL